MKKEKLLDVKIKHEKENRVLNQVEEKLKKEENIREIIAKKEENGLQKTKKFQKLNHCQYKCICVYRNRPSTFKFSITLNLQKLKIYLLIHSHNIYHFLVSSQTHDDHKSNQE